MSIRTNIQVAIEIGHEHPFDQDDEGVPQIHTADWTVKAARAIIVDLQGRRNIKWGFDNIDADIRKEIVETMAEIIRTVEFDNNMSGRSHG